MSDDFEIELKSMAHGGAAVGRHTGRAIFVPYVLPGELVRARITQDKDRFAYAEAVEIVSRSPARAEPPCPHFGPGLCGGCQWQHIAYPQQLEYKRLIVIDQLERIGKLRSPSVHPTLPSPSAWGYRAHMTFSVGPGGALGFWSDDNSRIIPIEECHILHPELMKLFKQLDLEALAASRVRFQIGSDLAEQMIVLEIDGEDAPEVEVTLPVSVNLLTGDNEPVNLIGSPKVTYRVQDRAFRVTAGGFFEVNLPMAEALVEEVTRRLALTQNDSVLDLYSGVGLFTAFIAAQADFVTSVESYPPAVSDADVNLAEFDNVDLIEGTVEAVLADLKGPFDAVVADPPRTGLGPKVVAGLIRLRPPRIVYVSCDPATLARDAAQLVASGYHLLDVQPIDMFPQTYHIECVATLERR
jgi:23S rRNA (uracil1939-C5)-methyltransferase